jgi:uncharacterized repeat protein (TIGR03833 family)
MSHDGNYKENLNKGMSVEINPQADRSRKIREVGEIEEILTNSSQHSHGILVRLTNGQIGRVKAILQSSFVSSSDEPPSSVVEIQQPTDIHELILGGENHFVEFKSSALWSVNLSQKDIVSGSSEVKTLGKNTSKFIIAKTIAAFLNSDGGTLVIGLKENKDENSDEIIGIQSEFYKLKDPCIDGYRRMIVDQVIRPSFPPEIFYRINDYLSIRFETINNKILCLISVFKSDSQVFLKKRGQDCFYVRVDATTREISGEDMVRYCVKKFSR